MQIDGKSWYILGVEKFIIMKNIIIRNQVTLIIFCSFRTLSAGGRKLKSPDPTYRN